MRHLHRRTGILLSALLLIGGVAGCADADAGDAPKPSTPRTAPNESAPPTSQAPSVEPARGAAVEIPVLKLRVTEDLRWLPFSTRLTASATAVLDDGYPASVTASELQSVQNDLDAYARAFIEVSTYDPRPTRLENRAIDGAEAWVAEAVGAELRSYWVGGIHGDRQWSVQIETPVSLADAEATQLRERILASIEFTGAPSA